MKKLAIVLGVCFLSVLTMTTQAQENEEYVMNLTEYTIKFGHNANFVEGVKKWKKCYKDNNGTNKWNVWHRVQGKGNVYVVTSPLKNWAEMDENDAPGRACRSVALEFVTPHIESREDDTFKSMLEFSNKGALGDNTLIWVYGFNVNDRKAFLEVIKEVSAAIKTKEGEHRGYWYRSLAGQGEDYFVTTPYKNFAELDKEEDSVWAVYESVHGKTKTEKIRAKFSASLDNITSLMYTLNKDLSMQ